MTPLSRVALGLRDKTTGITYSADDLRANILASGVTSEQLTASIKSNEELMSAMGKSMVSALRVLRPVDTGTFLFSCFNIQSFSPTVQTTTGFYRIINQDNSLGPQNNTTISPSGLHRAMGVMSVEDGGESSSGSITSIVLAYANATSVDIQGLSAVTILDFTVNQISSIILTDLINLTDIVLNNNKTKSLLITGSPLLNRLRNPASPVLEEIIVEGASLNYQASYGQPGIELASSNLSADALNTFFTSLGNGTGIINVANNPGSATCDPTIATAKGYTVLGV